MARTIQVTPEQLESAATKILDLAGDYQELYNQFYSKTGSMAQSWEGKENLAFIDQINGFKDDFNKMYTLMTQYAEFLQKSAKAYRDTQDAVTADARKLVN